MQRLKEPEASTSEKKKLNKPLSFDFYITKLQNIMAHTISHILWGTDGQLPFPYTTQCLCLRSLCKLCQDSPFPYATHCLYLTLLFCKEHQGSALVFTEALGCHSGPLWLKWSLANSIPVQLQGGFTYWQLIIWSN
jgi:hypothetical protein